jgi:hypothetical protein
MVLRSECQPMKQYHPAGPDLCQLCRPDLTCRVRSSLQNGSLVLSKTRIEVRITLGDSQYLPSADFTGSLVDSSRYGRARAVVPNLSKAVTGPRTTRAMSP